jgi:hypothetical protein
MSEKIVRREMGSNCKEMLRYAGDKNSRAYKCVSLEIPLIALAGQAAFFVSLGRGRGFFDNHAMCRMGPQLGLLCS